MWNHYLCKSYGFRRIYWAKKKLVKKKSKLVKTLKLVKKKFKTCENTKTNGFRRIRRAKEKLFENTQEYITHLLTKLWIVQKNFLSQGKTRKNTSSLIIFWKLVSYEESRFCWAFGYSFTLFKAWTLDFSPLANRNNCGISDFCYTDSSIMFGLLSLLQL